MGQWHHISCFTFQGMNPEYSDSNFTADSVSQMITIYFENKRIALFLDRTRQLAQSYVYLSIKLYCRLEGMSNLQNALSALFRESRADHDYTHY